MDRPPGRDDLRKSGSRRGTKLRFTPAKLGKGGRGVMQCDDTKPFSIVEIKRTELAFADTRRIRQHGSKHRLQFTGRTRDHLQHIGGRGLLLQRLGEFLF